MANVQLKSSSDNINPIPALPVGYIYISFNSTSPASMFGGSWTQITDAFLLGAGSTYSNGSTGGASSVTLDTSHLPSHTHTISGESNYNSNRTNCGITKYTTRTKYGTKSTGAAGEGSAHNNMPPYLCVYMWKKTAQ